MRMTGQGYENVGVVPAWRLCDRLRRAREFVDLDQADLARELGISRNSVGNYEREVTRPRRAVLLAWALRCGVPFEWLADGEWAPRGSNPQPTDYKMAFSSPIPGRRRAAA
jgi:transcriptional regulator with XRE-family HTH domain